ncbi:MAG: hypothetical protein JRJ84_06360, partial [Deltaproteobacteria bacterium]|nr:hypothetical protein [Deltaproteobacteria bacterium]
MSRTLLSSFAAVGAFVLLAACGGGRQPVPIEVPAAASMPSTLAVPSARAVCPVLLYTSSKAAPPAQLVELVPAASLANPPGELVAGSWPQDVAEGSPQVVLSAHLAEQLGIGPGDELFGLWTSTDGALSNDLFRCVGILALSIPWERLDAA